MPVLKLDEIPRDAGQNLAPLGAHSYIVFDSDTTHIFHVNARFYGNHIPGFKSN